MMTLGEWLNGAKCRLEESGSPDPQTDAEWMAVDVMKIGRSSLARFACLELEEDKLAALDTMLTRRETGEPLQYIEGFACFMGLDFYVDSHVLIPRPDTETLVEAVLKALGGKKSPRVLDICTGSGVIGLSIAHYRKDADVTVSDISAEALAVAQKNAGTLGVRARLLQGDLFAPVAGEAFDAVCANPPYIPDADMRTLQREVTWEPSLALKGGEDGMDLYRRIAAGLGQVLNPGGMAALEVGIGQAEYVEKMMMEALPDARTQVLYDLGGVARVVVVFLK